MHEINLIVDVLAAREADRGDAHNDELGRNSINLKTSKESSQRSISTTCHKLTMTRVKPIEQLQSSILAPSWSI